MRLVWDELAVKRINETADYIEDLYGTDRCIHFLEDI